MESSRTCCPSSNLYISQTFWHCHHLEVAEGERQNRLCFKKFLLVTDDIETIDRGCQNPPQSAGRSPWTLNQVGLRKVSLCRLVQSLMYLNLSLYLFGILSAFLFLSESRLAWERVHSVTSYQLWCIGAAEGWGMGMAGWGYRRGGGLSWYFYSYYYHYHFFY